MLGSDYQDGGERKDAAWSTIIWSGARPVCRALPPRQAPVVSGVGLGLTGSQVRKLVEVGEPWVLSWSDHPLSRNI